MLSLTASWCHDFEYRKSNIFAFDVESAKPLRLCLLHTTSALGVFYVIALYKSTFTYLLTYTTSTEKKDLTNTNCTMDQELAVAVAYAAGRRCVSTHQMAALLCVTLRHSCHLDSMTSHRKINSVKRCVFT